MSFSRRNLVPKLFWAGRNNQKTLDEILDALEGISPTDKKAENKLKDLIGQNNQLKNDIEIRSSISSIPYSWLSSSDSAEEKETWWKKVEEVKKSIKLKIVHLLDHNSDIDAIDIANIVLSDDIMRDVSSIKEVLLCHNELADYWIPLPTGYLFAGPAGVGKTETSRWLSKMIGANFLSIRMSDILHWIVWESEKAITQLFTNARNQNILTWKPSIIFIDEADKLLWLRELQQHSLVQHFLSLVDWFYKNKEIVVILSTNKMHLIDASVLSRMNKKIQFELPTLENIPKIFKVHLLQASNEQIKQKYETFLTTEYDALLTIFSRLHAEKASWRDIKNILTSAKTDFMLRHKKDANESLTVRDIEMSISKTLLPEETVSA